MRRWMIQASSQIAQDVDSKGVCCGEELLAVLGRSLLGEEVVEGLDLLLGAQDRTAND